MVVLALPIVLIGVFAGDDGGRRSSASTTLARLPDAQCRALRDVAAAAVAARNAMLDGRSDVAAKAAALARFEFVAQAARRDAPAPLRTSLGMLASQLHRSRDSFAANRDEASPSLLALLVFGPTDLRDAFAMVGSACGAPLRA
jgi:hypothetical protein